MAVRQEQGYEFEFENEFEQENEFEFEAEHENEYESEQFLGGLLGGLLGESESESEYEYENEFEYEFEQESEQFLGKIRKMLRRAVPKLLPVLQSVAGVASPVLSKVISGAVGNMPAVGGMVQNIMSRAMQREHEFEFEYEFESEYESESEFEFENEGEYYNPMPEHEMLAEYMAGVASSVQSEHEAEAMIAAATISVLSAQDRAVLRDIIPGLVRATTVLTELLRRTEGAKPAVRLIPHLVKRVAIDTKKQVAQGVPPKPAAARAIAKQTKQVLTNPKRVQTILQRNVLAQRALGRRPSKPVPTIRAARPAPRPARSNGASRLRRS